MNENKKNVQKSIAIFKQKSSVKRYTKCEPRTYVDELLKLVPQLYTKIVELNNEQTRFQVEFEHVSWCTLIVVEGSKSLQELRELEYDFELSDKEVKYMIVTNQQDLIVKQTSCNSAFSFSSVEISEHSHHLVVLCGFELANGVIYRHDDLRQKFVELYEQMNETEYVCEDLDLIFAKFTHVVWSLKQLDIQAQTNFYRHLVEEAMYYFDQFGTTLVTTIEVCGKPVEKRSRLLPDVLKCLPYLDCALHDMCTAIPELNQSATQRILNLVGCKWSLDVDLSYMVRLVDEIVGQEITIESINGKHVEVTKSIFYLKSRTNNLILKPLLISLMKPKAGQLSLFND